MRGVHFKSKDGKSSPHRYSPNKKSNLRGYRSEFIPCVPEEDSINNVDVLNASSPGSSDSKDLDYCETELFLFEVDPLIPNFEKLRSTNVSQRYEEDQSIIILHLLVL